MINNKKINVLRDIDFILDIKLNEKEDIFILINWIKR